MTMTKISRPIFLAGDSNEMLVMHKVCHLFLRFLLSTDNMGLWSCVIYQGLENMCLSKVNVSLICMQLHLGICDVITAL